MPYSIDAIDSFHIVTETLKNMSLCSGLHRVSLMYYRALKWLRNLKIEASTQCLVRIQLPHKKCNNGSNLTASVRFQSIPGMFTRHVNLWCHHCRRESMVGCFHDYNTVPRITDMWLALGNTWKVAGHLTYLGITFCHMAPYHFIEQCWLIVN